MSSASHAPYYFVPAPSKWPAVGSVAMILTLFGAVGTINSQAYGPWTLLAGFLVLIYMFFGWFGTVIAESEGGQYNSRVDASFRWSMSWFIFSEVMFFAAFFGALFYARVISMPWLGDLDHKSILWPDFIAQWGKGTGPAGLIEEYKTMGPCWIPTINTALLLSWGVTLTIAHHALRDNNRGKLNFWLAVTILLGFVFLGFQAYEYAHAYADLNLKLTSGIFGSTFFYAHRLSWLSRLRRCDHADGHAGPLRAWPLQAEPAFRLRGRRLVLALRGCGLAGPVYPGLLAVNQYRMPVDSIQPS